MPRTTLAAAVVLVLFAAPFYRANLVITGVTWSGFATPTLGSVLVLCWIAVAAAGWLRPGWVRGPATATLALVGAAMTWLAPTITRAAITNGIDELTSIPSTVAHAATNVIIHPLWGWYLATLAAIAALAIAVRDWLVQPVPTPAPRIGSWWISLLAAGVGWEVCYVSPLGAAGAFMAWVWVGIVAYQYVRASRRDGRAWLRGASVGIAAGIFGVVADFLALGFGIVALGVFGEDLSYSVLGLSSAWGMVLALVASCFAGGIGGEAATLTLGRHGGGALPDE